MNKARLLYLTAFGCVLFSYVGAFCRLGPLGGGSGWFDGH